MFLFNYVCHMLVVLHSIIIYAIIQFATLYMFRNNILRVEDNSQQK